MEPHTRTGRADLNALSLPEAYAALARGGAIRRLLELARDEDLGPDEPVAPGPGDRPRRRVGDVTTGACIRADRRVVAAVTARQAGVAAGLAGVRDVLDVFAPGVEHEPALRDGERFSAGDVLCVLRGPMDEILEVERTLLNLIGRLSGIATLTFEHVRALGADVRAKIFDTRKTTPGLRVLEKYAVRCGGGYCHRLGLHDAMLIKDNHLAGVSVEELPDFVARAVAEARAATSEPLSFIEVEADSFAQFQALSRLPVGVVDVILLDNFWPQSQDGYTLRDAVMLRDVLRMGVELEASGGVRLDNLREIGESGIDRISIGALTHQARSVDVALDIVESGATTTVVETPREDVSSWAGVLERDLTAMGVSCISRVRVMDEVESTQDAAEQAADGVPGLMVIAGRQRAGRGRLGRTWSDGDGRGLAVTFVLDANQCDAGLVALTAGVACAMSAERSLPESGPRSGRRRLGIRWPNDVVDRTTGRKLAGVLIERRGDLLLVGIGINVSQRAEDWPADLRETAISLAECGSVLDRLSVLRVLLATLDSCLRLAPEALIEAWMQRDVLVGDEGTFVVGGHELTGRVLAIEPTLELIIRTPDGERHRLPAATTTLLRSGMSA